MSSEFRLPTNESGLTVYGVLYNSTSQVWGGSSFAAYSTGSYANYDLAATELGSGGTYVINMPSGVTTPGIYEMQMYEQIGGSPAEGDRWLGSVNVDWNGGEVTSSVSSDDRDLISLAELKEFLKITTTNQNAILQTLIHDVSAWVQTYLSRNLVSEDYVEYYSGDDSIDLQLRNYPLTNLDSVYVDANRDFASDSLIDSSDLIQKKSKGILQAFNLFGNWPAGQSNIKVSYTAGYTVGSDSSAGTMPHDIRLAVKRIIDKQFRIGYTHNKLDYQSEAIQGMNITFQPDAIPKDAKLMLDPYRRFLPSPQFEYAD